MMRSYTAVKFKGSWKFEFFKKNRFADLSFGYGFGYFGKLLHRPKNKAKLVFPIKTFTEQSQGHRQKKIDFDHLEIALRQRIDRVGSQTKAGNSKLTYLL